MTSNMTFHAQVERRARLDYIIDTVGIGEVIAEIRDERDPRIAYQRLTSTGVVVIVGADKRTIVTAFIANIDQAILIYKNAKNVSRLPDGLYRRIKGNQKYRRNQPCMK